MDRFADGLAGSLGIVAAAFFAIDAVTIHVDDLLLAAFCTAVILEAGGSA